MYFRDLIVSQFLGTTVLHGCRSVSGILLLLSCKCCVGLVEAYRLRLVETEGQFLIECLEHKLAE